MRPQRPFMNGGNGNMRPFPLMNVQIPHFFNFSQPGNFQMRSRLRMPFNPFLNRFPGQGPQMHTRPRLTNGPQRGKGFPGQGPHMNSPPRLTNGPQRGKRQIWPEYDDDDDDGDSKKKKARSDDSVQSDEQFNVPCSKGTEQITVSIWEYFLKSKMSETDMEKKLMLQKTLQSIVEGAFPGSRLFIVGSSMTGFATSTSDVDMCLLLSEKDMNQKRDAVLVLTALLKSLRFCSFVLRPQVIRAKVPILKFRDKISGFECDININNTIGIRNTHLLRYYAHMDWRVRPLMLFIKHWARFHDINDASKKTVSSYSLSLMLLHYLQVGANPPVLPCLQALKPKIFSKLQDVRKLSLELEDIDFTSSNKFTLGELFLGFLDYYSNIFRYDMDIISVRTGKRISHDDVSYEDSDWKFLCIEEPYEGTNTARSVYDHFVFLRILRVFHSSFNTLHRHRNTNSILQCPF